MGSAMASMPYYLSTGVNKLTASAVDDAVDGLKTMLLLTITALGEIIYFVLNMMYSTYACLIAVAVNGTIKAGIEVVEAALGSSTRPSSESAMTLRALLANTRAKWTP